MVKHIYHYNTHGEKRYFLGPEHHDLYDIIALNGNIVSHTPEGIAAFLATAAKDFYIDPQTHAFQHATINLKRDVSDKEKKEEPRYEFKPSIIKLAKERLGEPFSSVITSDKPISPAVFLDDDNNIKDGAIDRVCQSVKNFQLEMIESELDEEAKEFIESSSGFKPKFVIAPYFYLSKLQWKEWLKINIACYKRMKEIVTETPTYLSLVISRDALDNDAEIVKAISEIKPEGILLWIDSHVEEELSKSEVVKYTGFLKNLKKSTETIYNSHGGYLSILLCHSEIGCLDGVAHSANYGEHRNVVPVGGGLPMARFYLHSIHSRLKWGDALGVVLPQGWLDSVDNYREKICKCHQCQELLSKKSSAEKTFDLYGKDNSVTITRRNGTIVRLNYPTKEAKQAATRHYLYNKAKEFKDIQEKTFSVLLQELNAAYEEISKKSGEDAVAHLRIWHDVLNS